MKEDLDRIEKKVDGLKDDVADLRVMVEHRVTKLEVKAAVLGFFGGLIPAVASLFKSRP